MYAWPVTNSEIGASARDIDQSLVRVLHRRAVASGTITLPAVPGMLDEYVDMCEKTFSAIGVEFNSEQRARLRAVLEGELVQAFSASQRSEIVITYDSPVGNIVNYHVNPRWLSVDESYDAWTALREPPYFGAEPDARVIALAAGGDAPTDCPVLDVGAGTGRNSLALARLGHPVDAVEPTGAFADMIRTDSDRDSLGIRVLRNDIFDALEYLRRDYKLIVVSEVVSDFRTTAELRSILVMAAECLAPGGQLVLNALLACTDYEPDDAARQLGQQVLSMMFTYAEVNSAMVGLPLELISDESVCEYERDHLPSHAWPPTPWFENWANGLDVFALSRESSPIELRWLVWRKIG